MADNSVKKLFAYYLLKLKSFFFSKDVLSFLLFLAISAGFWFVNSLDKEREMRVSIPVEFSGIPQNVTMTGNLDRNIVVTVKDQGINLFAYLGRNNTPIIFELNQIFYEKGKIVYGTDQIRGRLSRYLRPTTVILSMKPDSIVLRYEKLSSKVLPIQLDARISLAQQYTLSDKISLSPPQITVFGPKRLLDKTDKVLTNRFELNNVSDTVIKTVKLKHIKGLRFAAYETKVGIFAEMFTEKKLVIPVTVINCPSDVIIKTFPANVEATFNVAMSYFKSVSTNDFKVVLDYNDLHENSTKYRLKTLNSASYISNIRIDPLEVEYIREAK